MPTRCIRSCVLLVPLAMAASIPPPQRSLEIPPIIDPSKTAVLSGLVAVKSTPETEVADGLRSVVWMVRPASLKPQPSSDQVMVLDAFGFKPATVVTSPKSRVELRGSERGIRVVRGSGAERFERRLDRSTASAPILVDRVGAIELAALPTEEARASAGSIVIVDSPFATVADGEGAFRIVGLPPGRQQVRMRLSDGKEFSRTVDLRAGKELVVDWRDVGATKGAPAPIAPGR